MKRFELRAGDVDLVQLREGLQHPGSGGFCSFEGWVRNNNEGREVSGLEYEAYAELAIVEGQRIIDEAFELYGVLAACAVHRVGDLRIGDLAVWIGVSAPHRDEAFRACRYIIDEIKHRLPIWKKEHYLQGDTAWVACSHTERAHETDHAHTHTHQHEQEGDAPLFTPDYSRQERLYEVGELGQRRLSAARVLVIGAGGLGVPVISYLAGAGVGVLGVVDGDVLDASNLHRQVMYDARDVGERKAGLAARRVAALNPSVEVIQYDEPLQPDNIAQVFEQYDLVVECTDDLASRYLANDAAVLTDTPLILASVYQYEGQLQVVTAVPGEPCLRCLWRDAPAPVFAGTCAEAGVLGPVPGVLGTMQAMEALKLLLDLPRSSDHALQLLNLLDGTQLRLPINPAKGCALQGGCKAVASSEMAKTKAAENLERSFSKLEDAIAAGFVLVDLREQDEIESLPLDVSARHVRAIDIQDDSLTWPTEPLLLICAQGKRSTHAAGLLRARGLDAFSLAGGMKAVLDTVR